jgi:hypothetical protein
MSPRRASSLPYAIDLEPTPQPASAVGSAVTAEGAPRSSRREAARTSSLLDYFANPSPEAREVDAAWQEALALYDEDSDAWVEALQNGTHPLCRVRTAGHPA